MEDAIFGWIIVALGALAGSIGSGVEFVPLAATLR